MAEIAPTVIFNERNDIKAFKWAGMTEADTAVPVRDLAAKTDATVMVVGDFGSGGDIRIEGTLDPDEATFVDLHDPQGNVIAFTTADNIETILENVPILRPRLEAGTSVDVDIYLMLE